MQHKIKYHVFFSLLSLSLSLSLSLLSLSLSMQYQYSIIFISIYDILETHKHKWQLEAWASTHIVIIYVLHKSYQELSLAPLNHKNPSNMGTGNSWEPSLQNDALSIPTEGVKSRRSSNVTLPRHRCFESSKLWPTCNQHIPFNWCWL